MLQVDIRAPGTGEPPDAKAIEDLAALIHGAEKAAIDGGFVLVKLNRPGSATATYPPEAQAGRRRQARYLLEHFVFESRRD